MPALPKLQRRFLRSDRFVCSSTYLVIEFSYGFSRTGKLFRFPVWHDVQRLRQQVIPSRIKKELNPEGFSSFFISSLKNYAFLGWRLKNSHIASVAEISCVVSPTSFSHPFLFSTISPPGQVCPPPAIVQSVTSVLCAQALWVSQVTFPF